MKLASVVLVAALALASLDADAQRRLGGGQSTGRQSDNVAQRETAPATPAAAPTAGQGQPAASPASRQGAANAAPASAPRRPWGAMLGGLAAGLGLAWLASTLGFGPQLAEFMLFGLLALVIMVVIGLILRRRPPAAATVPRAGARPMAYQGAAAAEAATAPRQYSPDKVGNDASARPWERSSMAFDAAKSSGGVQVGSALSGSASWSVPAGFDTEGFLSAAKRNFQTLQDAWDRSDMRTLRSMMTDEMLSEIRTQLAERERQSSGEPNETDVVMLDAQLLGIEDLGADYMASVEFSGMIREQPSAGPSPFREVWNMTRPKSGGSGWLVAGVQALQ